jgi:soluble lytic murein transglycosylase-like protein
MDGIAAIEARVSEIRAQLAQLNPAPGPAQAATRDFASVLSTAMQPSRGVAAVNGAAGAPGAVDSWIQAAIDATGVPQSWASGLQTIAEHESGLDPKAFNGNDRTASGGSQTVAGLMQMLPSTFAAHAQPGHNDIFNPVDNLIAAIDYIRGRYGDPSSTPGLKSLAAGGRYRGY